MRQRAAVTDVSKISDRVTREHRERLEMKDPSQEGRSGGQSNFLVLVWLLTARVKSLKLLCARMSLGCYEFRAPLLHVAHPAPWVEQLGWGS